MRNFASLAFMAIVMLLRTQSVMGQAEAAPVMTDVEATIFGPDCKPLANRAVEFSDTDKHPFPDRTPARATVTTDEHGLAHFRWKVGVSQISVKVRGVGYGMCGLTEFIPNVTTKPTFPPLAPYAAISGTIPKELIGKVVLVRALNGGIEEEPRQASVDQAGRFQFTDLMSGNCSLAAKDANGQFLAEAGFDLNPGVHIPTVKFTLNTRQEAQASTQPIVLGGRNADRDKTVTWASGVVRGAKGQPLPGADVYAVITYYGGALVGKDALRRSGAG